MGMNQKNKTQQLRKGKVYNFTQTIGYSVQWQILTNYTDVPFKTTQELFLALASTRPHSPT
jgi:hypothetical protein